MKQFFFLFFFSLTTFSVHSLVAQDKNRSYDTAKRDTTKFAILASETHSADDCGTRPSDGDKPVFNIIIEDLISDELKDVAAATYRAKVIVNIAAPYQKKHAFTFLKKRGQKRHPKWSIDVPCYAERAALSIEVQYKEKGKFKTLNINPNSKKNKLDLRVDFVNQKIYAPDQSKTLLGGFGKTVTSSGKKLPNAKKATLKIKIKKPGF
ncbi:MAG: hypothetical protein AB8B69_22805 [Chitinophagales bacterium]